MLSHTRTHTHTCQWWNVDRQKACPCVWVLKSVSNPNESMAGMNALIVYNGELGIGASWVTWPLLLITKQVQSHIICYSWLKKTQWLFVYIYCNWKLSNVCFYILPTLLYSPSPSQHSVHSRDTVSRRLYLYIIVWLHQSRGGLNEYNSVLILTHPTQHRATFTVPLGMQSRLLS